VGTERPRGAGAPWYRRHLSNAETRSQARVVLCFSGDLRAARERRQKPFLPLWLSTPLSQPPPGGGVRACVLALPCRLMTDNRLREEELAAQIGPVAGTQLSVRTST
jgi:hypothetical protein